jgi:hypothetical protein
MSLLPLHSLGGLLSPHDFIIPNYNGRNAEKPTNFHALLVLKRKPALKYRLWSGSLAHAASSRHLKVDASVDAVEKTWTRS